ncbi:PREDICTED: actin-like protein 6A [Rhagoletis zephyria]|uniref:actin-like protein 6A n=1 Tax=Rhagoletis zephyria TaxID=28612 RepID=UPI0008116554|nr:PREDICTED: actin-like protein 6A [Rhagoletis zephyria]
MSGGIYAGDELGALVFDVGHHSFRAGWAGEDSPKTDVPTTIGYIDDVVDANSRMDVDFAADHNGNSNLAPSSRRYIFDTTAIKSPQNNMDLTTFLRDGMIEDWDLFEKMTDYIYKKQLNLDSTLQPVLFSEASWNARSKREKLCELMFEKYGIPAFFLCKNAVLAAFANGRATGVILDSGASHTSAIPVHDGYVMQQAIVKSPLAGDFVTNQCKQYFDERGVEIVPYYMIASKEAVKESDPAKWTKRSNLPENLTQSWKNYMIKETLFDFKSSALQVSDTTYNKDVADNMPAIHYEFPNGYNLDLTSDRFLIPEALFDTTNIKGFTSSVMGMSQIVTTCVGFCDPEIRSSLVGNVIVTGGNTLINGFTERLNRDLVTKTPPSMRPKLINPNASVERRYGAWIGGSILASLPTFQHTWISKQEYEEDGKCQIERKCP